MEWKGCGCWNPAGRIKPKKYATRLASDVSNARRNILPPSLPAWLFDGAILLLAMLILFAIASCVFGRK
jgi:hypothetical protein